MWKEYEKKINEDVERGLGIHEAAEPAIDDFFKNLKISLEQVNYTIFRLQTDQPPLRDSETWDATSTALPEAYQMFQNSFDAVCRRWESVKKSDPFTALYQTEFDKILKDCKKLDNALKTLFDINAQAIFALHYSAFQHFLNS